MKFLAFGFGGDGPQNSVRAYGSPPLTGYCLGSGELRLLKVWCGMSLLSLVQLSFYFIYGCQISLLSLCTSQKRPLAKAHAHGLPRTSLPWVPTEMDQHSDG